MASRGDPGLDSPTQAVAINSVRLFACFLGARHGARRGSHALFFPTHMSAFDPKRSLESVFLNSRLWLPFHADLNDVVSFDSAAVECA